MSDDTRKIEDMTKDEAIQYYRMRAEGYQAVAETLFTQMAENLVVSAEALSALKRSDESVGVAPDGGLKALMATMRQSLVKVFPQVNSMNTQEMLAFLRQIQGMGLQ